MEDEEGEPGWNERYRVVVAGGCHLGVNAVLTVLEERVGRLLVPLDIRVKRKTVAFAFYQRDAQELFRKSPHPIEGTTAQGRYVYCLVFFKKPKVQLTEANFAGYEDMDMFSIDIYKAMWREAAPRLRRWQI